MLGARRPHNTAEVSEQGNTAKLFTSHPNKLVAARFQAARRMEAPFKNGTPCDRSSAHILTGSEPILKPRLPLLRLSVTTNKIEKI